MNAITKVSQITFSDVAEYLRLGAVSADEQNTLNNLIGVAKAFIRGYTGLTAEDIDGHEDFVIVVLILCQDMYDNRTLYVDTANLSHVVETILGMYRVNLL